MPSGKIWTCYVCRKEEVWGETWQCFNSIRGLEDGEPLLVTCSDVCRASIPDWEAELMKVFDQTGYVEPTPQFGQHRMYPDLQKKRKAESKRKRKPATPPEPVWGML